MDEKEFPETIPPTLCINLCETTQPDASANQLEEIIARTCREAGFPVCERLYAGSYFCENYFCALTDSFHESMRAFCNRYELKATLVVPIIGQAFLDRAWARLNEVLERFDDVYDEVVVNDVASYLELASQTDKRVGLGRLFVKEQRDARIARLMTGVATPTLSAEAMECIEASQTRPLLEIDPMADTVDASALLESCPEAEVAIHLPYCYATTGRNCGPASIDEPVDQKFILGHDCSRHCLRMRQGYLADGKTYYVKHGRAFYYSNPGCKIAGARTWRIVYAAAHETMDF